MKSDYQIQEDVMEEFKREPFLKASEIGVAVKNGVVTLSGQVDSYSKKAAAENAAKKVAGVKAVAEDIEIGISPSYHKNRCGNSASSAGCPEMAKEPKYNLLYLYLFLASFA